MENETTKCMKLSGVAPVKVVDLTGNTIQIDVKSSYTIERIKELIQEKSGIPPPQQRIMYRNRQMKDGTTVHQNNITGGSTLHLVLALRGGSVDHNA